MARKLAAFAGLRALRHLDFDFLRAGQIRRGDAEPAGGDLLDRGVGEVAILAPLEALGIFAAFAAVRLAADAVHGDGQRLVRLGAERAERHAGGGEADADVLDGFDFLDRDGPVLRDEVEHVLEGDRLLRFHRRHILLVFLRVAGLHEAVEGLDDRRRDRVVFAIAAEAIEPGIVELGIARRLRGNRREAFLMAGQRFARDLDIADAADLRRGPPEALLDDFRSDADGLEELRAAIAREHADAHFRHDLEQAALQRGAEILERLRVGQRFRILERGLGFRQLLRIRARFGDSLLRGDLDLVDDFARGIESEIGVNARSRRSR